MEHRKVYLNKHSNLLQLEEHMYPLVDVDTPNVFRNLFHYDEIGRKGNPFASGNNQRKQKTWEVNLENDSEQYIPWEIL